MEGAFETLVENIEAWFDDLSIVHRKGGQLAPSPKFLALVGALLPDDQERRISKLSKVPAPTISRLWRCALANRPIPYAVLAQAVMHARSGVIQDAPPNHARMGLIRAYHNREQGGVRMSPYVNEDHPDPAYHCGRLIAVLAGLQRAALGDVGAGVIQRYYTATSQTPALVIGRLVANAQHHLAKIGGGLCHWYEDSIAGIAAKIGDDPPKTLSLERQSLFALGYYQQLAADRGTHRKENTEEEKKND
jgi:CRISPR-associated protein Csd1